jgi:hypothetical protein
VAKLRTALIVVTVIVLAASSAAPATASALPRIWATVNSKGVAVYKVRPRTIDLSEAAGGTLTLSWSSWTRSAANGAGQAVASGMGTTTTLNVKVHASAVKHGRFTRLTLTTTASNGTPDVEKLHLSANGWIP